MCKENPKIEKDRSYEGDDDETNTPPISLAERMGSENVASGLVFESQRPPQKEKKND
jgi:hypothetical protein